MLSHRLDGSYRDIEKSEIFIQCVLWILEILGSCILFYKAIHNGTVEDCYTEVLSVIWRTCRRCYSMWCFNVHGLFSVAHYSCQVIIFPEESSRILLQGKMERISGFIGILYPYGRQNVLMYKRQFETLSIHPFLIQRKRNEQAFILNLL